MLEVFPLSDVLIAMTSGTGDCAEVVWRMLGLSIPAWALVGFTGLIVVSALQLRAGRAG
jgi:disulfide bond formation protein DsbB